MLKKWPLALWLIVAAGVVSGPAAAQPAGTLVVGLVAEPVNLDPPQVTDLNSNRVSRRIAETLVSFEYPFANYFFGNVKAVEAMDESTVRFVLKEPRASFLAVLAAGAASVVSPTAVKKWGTDYALNPVGTGPFRYVSWQRGQQVVLEKNPEYWRGPVKIDRVIYRPIVEDQARLTELLTGAVDLIVNVPPDFVGQLEGNAKVTLLKQVGAHVWYLGINNQKKPFDDKRVRQALNYAVNKDAIVSDVLKGTGAPFLLRQVAPHLLSPVIVAFSLDVGAKILATSGLSFLGLGTQPPTADWGSMLATGRQFVILRPHVVLLPGFAIFAMVLALNLVGDALRDLLDPRTRAA